MGTVALIQGLYFVLSGAWALVHIRSFQAVTGPKTDLWLVRTVGLLLVTVGSGLLMAGELDRSVVFIAMGSAASLLAIELYYVGARIISRIYLLDAAIETGFLVAWTAFLLL